MQDGEFHLARTNLILVNFCFFKFRLSLFLKSDDDQGHEDVDEEEGEDNEVDDVEDGHLHSEERYRSLVLVRRRHRLLKDPTFEQIVELNDVTQKGGRR